jgi:hypothetical protein
MRGFFFGRESIDPATHVSERQIVGANNHSPSLKEPVAAQSRKINNAKKSSYLFAKNTQNEVA